MDAVSRRRFLRISSATLGLAAAGSACSGSRPGPGMPAAGTNRTGIATVPTFCDICFWKCGAIAYVKDGRLWKIEGNPDDPLSRGRLCPRGTGGVGAHFDPDRLKAPLIRRKKRGEDEWAVVTWSEALGFVAERMQRIRAAHGPEAVALFSHGIGGNFLKHTLKAFGTPNIAAPSFAQCRGPRDVGFHLTFGEGVSSPERTDLANARCVVLIGSHLGENMHNTQVQEFAKAIERRIPIVVVDPRFSVAASKAKYWLPIRPGTDLALLLAWMNVLVGEGLHDRAFVEAHGHGFDRFAAEIAPQDPEWAAAETGIDAETIRATARELARHRPASLVHPGRRVNWYGDDAQRSRAVALVNALLGNWGRRGGLYVQAGIKVPAYPLPAYPKSQRPLADNPDRERYPFADEPVTTGIRETTLTGKPYPSKGWFVYSSNITEALPNRAETLKAIDALDLLVVVDTLPSEVAGYADVVLPESMFLERHDELLTGWGRQGWMAIRQPVVAPPGEQKAGWWIARQLAGKLGIPECMPFDDMQAYLAARVEKAGFSYATLKTEGVIMGPKQPTTVEEGLELTFDTPSGKVEFWSDQLAAKGFDPVPRYTRHPQAPVGHFRLVTGRAPVHTFTRTQTNPYLSDLMRENEVWVNGTTAQKLGLKGGQYTRLRNQDGVVSNRIRVKVTQRIRPDTVYMVYGFGHTSRMLKSAYLKGASASLLNTRYATDPLMGGTSIHGNFVSFVSEEA
jgi:thiosulfate reductase/polysulfide reductase chain A